MAEQTTFCFFETEITEKGDKQCIKCLKFLPEKCFPKRGGENYLRTECKECTRKLNRERKELKDKYGYAPKNYRCPICDRIEKECKGEGSETASAWAIDHCHETNTFRGWLCHKCNRGIGTFDDNIQILQKAINYLERG